MTFSKMKMQTPLFPQRGYVPLHLSAPPTQTPGELECVARHSDLNVPIGHWLHGTEVEVGSADLPWCCDFFFSISAKPPLLWLFNIPSEAVSFSFCRQHLSPTPQRNAVFPAQPQINHMI